MIDHRSCDNIVNLGVQEELWYIPPFEVAMKFSICWDAVGTNVEFATRVEIDAVRVDEIEGLTNTFGRECASASSPAVASMVVPVVRPSEGVQDPSSLKTIGTDVDSWPSQSGWLGSEVCLLDAELRGTSFRDGVWSCLWASAYRLSWYGEETCTGGLSAWRDLFESFSSFHTSLFMTCRTRAQWVEWTSTFERKCMWWTRTPRMVGIVWVWWKNLNWLKLVLAWEEALKRVGNLRSIPRQDRARVGEIRTQRPTELQGCLDDMKMMVTIIKKCMWSMDINRQGSLTRKKTKTYTRKIFEQAVIKSAACTSAQ